MPSIEKHAQFCVKQFGKENEYLCYRVNSWIDSPVRREGRYHRYSRHDWKRTPIEALVEFLPWFKKRFIAPDGGIAFIELAKATISHSDLYNKQFQSLKDTLGQDSPAVCLEEVRQDFKDTFGQDLPEKGEPISPEQEKEFKVIIEMVLQHLELDGVFNPDWLPKRIWSIWNVLTALQKE
jgi:hypothetical protein